MRDKDYIVEIRRGASPYLPALFSVRVTDPSGGRQVPVSFGELADALHMVARVFQPQVTKVTKVTKKKVTKHHPPGYWVKFVTECLSEKRMTFAELMNYFGGRADPRGMASVLRSLCKKGIIGKQKDMYFTVGR